MYRVFKMFKFLVYIFWVWLLISFNNILLCQNINFALNFNGSIDYVNCGTGGIPDNPQIVTQEAWIKTTTEYGTIITKRHADDGSDWPSILVVEGKAVICVDDQNERYDVASTTSVNNNIWHHILGVKDGNKYSIYVDGILENTQTNTYPMNGSPYNLHIGHHGAWNEWFEGQIDEVRIWDIVLTKDEIQANMYKNLTGSENGLVGYWPFNEGLGNITNDFSGNNNHGIINGATWISSTTLVGTVMIFCNPNHGYQNHTLFTTIQGANTHFSDGIIKIWLSKEDKTITADRFTVTGNTLLQAQFYIPADASPGQWNANVETVTDSIISMPFGIEVFPPPSVTAQNSSTSSWLQSVYALDDKTCWSVGNDGSIQKTTDSGITWESQNSDIPNVLYSVFFVNEMTGWVVGQYGIILQTTNGGEDWMPQTSGTSNNLQSVYFVDANVGWAVGRSGTILKTVDGGITWEEKTSGTTSWLYSVCFTDANNGWVVGSNGTILNTVDGGEGWNSQNSGTNNYLSSVCFYDSVAGWVVGSEGTILRTIDGGENWLSKESNTTEWLKSVSFRGGETGFALGNKGVFIMTEDGGNSWSGRETWTNKSINSVHFANDITGWAVGETGTVLYLTMNNLAMEIENDKIEPSVPQNFVLYQNYPNPFNPRTTIHYELPLINFVELTIHNLLGQKVATLVSETKNAGDHQVEWDASGFASGLYYYKIETSEFQDVKKMILLR